MPSKQPIHTDIFADSRDDGGLSDWLARCRKAQWNLEKVKNPYVGNKRKLLVDLGSVLFKEGLADIVDGGNTLDLFTGSGFVAYLFKSLGSCVWANDILASSAVNALSLIETQHTGMMPFMKGILDQRLVDSEAANTFFLDKYHPKRFSEREAKRLASIREAFDDPRPYADCLSLDRLGPGFLHMMHFGQTVSDPKKEFNPYAHGHIVTCAIMHYVMNACFVGGRLNSGQILAKFEHRIEHARNAGSEMFFHADDIPLYDIAVQSDKVCRATRSDAIELLRSDEKHTRAALDSLDIVYIDPPYGGDQSDYSAMYEFVEDFMFYGSDLKDEIFDQKRFAKSKTYEESFVELLDSLPSQAIWIFSYNDSSWADIDGITDPIKRFRNNVTVREIDYRYHYRKDQSAGTEYVILARPEN
jgi:adenine-specific DNA methylase